MNSKIKNLLPLAFTGGYAVNLKALNSRYKPHNTLGFSQPLHSQKFPLLPLCGNNGCNRDFIVFEQKRIGRDGLGLFYPQMVPGI
jgi:hypothetical protein